MSITNHIPSEQYGTGLRCIKIRRDLISLVVSDSTWQFCMKLLNEADEGSMPRPYYFKQYIDFKVHLMITQWYDLLYVDHSFVRQLRRTRHEGSIKGKKKRSSYRPLKKLIIAWISFFGSTQTRIRYYTFRAFVRVSSSMLQQSIGWLSRNEQCLCIGASRYTPSRISSLYEHREKPNVTAAIGNGYQPLNISP